MSPTILRSDLTPRAHWQDATSLTHTYGPKGALLTVLPRVWTPPFLLLSSSVAHSLIGADTTSSLSSPLDEVITFCCSFRKVIVRSSVLGETIWERGKYRSEIVDVKSMHDCADRLAKAVKCVVESAGGRETALVFQEYHAPVYSGEFANLQRVSSTRDHWELSLRSRAGGESRTRFNTQRDQAANPDLYLGSRISLNNVRFFGSIGAWINNELLLGISTRVTCEWIFDGKRVFIVQIDEETEDVGGFSPHQMRIPKMFRPKGGHGNLLRSPDKEAISTWDKLKVLEQLWIGDYEDKPVLSYLPVSDLLCNIKKLGKSDACSLLEKEITEQIGQSGIIVRTSGRADEPKQLNLPRTEGLSAEDAALWCFCQAHEISQKTGESSQRSFVVHQFIASRASAWSKANPEDAIVEIHANWGVAEALQFFPFDLVEVHVPTDAVVYNTDYKSNFVRPMENGRWNHERIKNEVARHRCIARQDAIHIAHRSLEIAQRLGCSCHIMWFVGCRTYLDRDANIPWYWTPAHDAAPNPHRIPPKTVQVRTQADVQSVASVLEQDGRYGIHLCPDDLNLMRDRQFLADVATLSKKCSAPIVLEGSSLAHAFYQLQREGCTILPGRPKVHSRVRQVNVLGKLVRDRVPKKIQAQMEHTVIQAMPQTQTRGFLVGKLIEEILEFREAVVEEHCLEELADAFEVINALTTQLGKSKNELVSVAERKRQRAGGFDEGLVLIETSIGSRSDGAKGGSLNLGLVTPRMVSNNTIEVPFAFFGFSEMDSFERVFLDKQGVQIGICLKPDRITISVEPQTEQLSLPLYRK